MSFEDVQSSEPTVDEMFAATSEQETPEQPAQEDPKTEEPQMFEYTALGQTRKEPLELILKRASQGYDYAQKMEQFKAQQAEIEAAKARADEIHNKYAQIDEYASQNPEWYEHWSQAYEQRQAGLNNQEQPIVDLSPIKSEIDALKQEFGGVKEFVTKQQESQEDSKYWDEVKAVQSEYPDIDMSLADEQGKTLEYKILEHAKDNGIGSFRVAFRDFYHDKLQKRMLEKAKQDLLAKDKDNRKKGIVGVSTTPMLNTDMPDLRDMSESEILQAAIDDFNKME